jgi:tRNA G37 N-methylase TrmD
MLNNKYNIPIEDISYKKLLLYCVKYHGFDEHIIKEIIKTMIIDDSFNINEFLNSFENVYDR